MFPDQSEIRTEALVALSMAGASIRPSSRGRCLSFAKRR
jgi:hypothetical protein